MRVLIVVALVALIYIVLAGSISKNITEDDIKAIRSLGIDRSCAQTKDFEGQIECIKAAQQALREKLPDMTCGAVGLNYEPPAIMKRQHACCFGRARFLEKTFEHYGIKTRHVSLFDRSRHGWFTILVPGTPSHAVLEALTSRGWMGVDSMDDLILITREGKPLTFRELKTAAPESLSQKPHKKELEQFYARPLVTVYGLYSRHGMFFGPNLPAPEIHYPDFLKYNL